MPKSRNFNNELIDLRQEVMVCFQNVLPDKQFQAQMILALIGLHLIDKRILSSRDLEVRRRLICEFERHKEIITKNLAVLKQGMKPNEKTDIPTAGSQATSVCNKLTRRNKHKNMQTSGLFKPTALPTKEVIEIA